MRSTKSIPVEQNRFNTAQVGRIVYSYYTSSPIANAVIDIVVMQNIS